MKNEKKLTREKRRLLFYIIMFAYPILQFSIMYFYVNINSLTMAFREYSYADGQNLLVSKFAGFRNFSSTFKILFSSLALIKNSLIYYVVHLVVCTGFGIVFSYYIYKNYPLSGIFRIILFVPNIVASIVLATVYKYLAEIAYPEMMKSFGFENAQGLFANPNTRYVTLLIFNLWIGFGTTVLLMSGTMSGINESIIESAQLDGVNTIQEFCHIVVPLSFPTIKTFVITGLASLFVNSMHVLDFYSLGTNAPEQLQTFGYRFLLDVQKASYVDSTVRQGGGMTYPQVSALGLVFSAVTFVVVTVVKKLLENFGPSVD